MLELNPIGRIVSWWHYVWNIMQQNMATPSDDSKLLWFLPCAWPAVVWGRQVKLQKKWGFERKGLFHSLGKSKLRELGSTKKCFGQHHEAASTAMWHNELSTQSSEGSQLKRGFNCSQQQCYEHSSKFYNIFYYLFQNSALISAQQLALLGFFYHLIPMCDLNPRQ